MEESRRLSRYFVYLIIAICIVVVAVLYRYIFIRCLAGEVTTIFLVRHAEYDHNTGHLTLNGQERANELVAVLSQVDVKVIYVSQYDRTKETAQPLATALNLQWNVMNDLDLLVDQVKQDHAGEEVLVVGHSNTVPEIIDKLVGVSAGYSIEDDEFHHFFIVTISDSGEWWAVNAHYGERP